MNGFLRNGRIGRDYCEGPCQCLERRFKVKKSQGYALLRLFKSMRGYASDEGPARTQMLALFVKARGGGGRCYHTRIIREVTVTSQDSRHTNNE